MIIQGFKKLTIYCMCSVVLLTSTQLVGAETDPIISKIENQLRSSGHYHLIWISKSYPYVVEACQKFKSFSYTFNKKRRIKNKSDLGDCHINQPALPMRAIMTKLEELGYSRLRVRGVGLTGIQIRACRDDRRLILEVNHWGGILHSHSSGRCEAITNQENVTVIR